MTINLIPPKFKKERAIKRTFGIVIFGFVALGLMVIAVTAIFLLSNVFAQNDIKNINMKIQDQQATILKYKELEDDINSTNGKLKKLDSLSSKKIFWSMVLTDLANSTPEKIQITNFSISQITAKGTLNGIAETRRDIAKFKEKLEASNYFKNVGFSASSYQEATNDYTYTMSLEIELIPDNNE